MQIINRSQTAKDQSVNWVGMSPVLQMIYQNRGLQHSSELEYELANLLSSGDMLGVDDAVAALIPVVTEQKRLLVVGDFDVDGASSTAVVIRSLRAMGAQQVDYLVPNRFDFGYGLTPALVEVAKEYQPDLLLTVDNGIAAVDGVAAANQAGIPVVVTDHHLPGEQMPAAAAVVNPNQHGCAFQSKAACGCTVVFYVMLALRKALQNLGYFTPQQPSPNMAQFLDLVALATVADVVPMDRNNRLLVAQGLKRLRSGGGQVGVHALLQVAKRDAATIVGADFGFALGPRLNAAGRLDDMSIGIECLLTDDPQQALNYAQVLDDFNKNRRQIEQSMQTEALAMLPDLATMKGSDKDVVGITLYREDWHQGVLGILASRIKETLHRPVITCAADSDQAIKGSARSIPGLHIRDALDLVNKRYPGVLLKFGGHAMAAGMTIKRSGWSDFQHGFDQVCRELLSKDQLERCIYTDGQLSSELLTMSLAEQIRYGGPWGQEFPEPAFDNRFSVTQHKIVGEKHLKLTLQMLDGSQSFDAIWFNADLEGWQQWLSHPNRLNSEGVLHCVYQLDINYFRGRQSLQLLLRHVALNN